MNHLRQFLEYGIGEQHTRHDQIVSYFKRLASVSKRAEITYYGRTHEGRKLTFLIVSSEENLEKLDEIQKQHIAYAKGNLQDQPDIPVIINLAYNVHGNEPSSSEAAMLLAAYTLVASEHSQVQNLFVKTQ